MNQKKRAYIPALNQTWLIPSYDPFIKWGMHEAVFKHYLVERTQLRPGYRVLDLGCGTGTFQNFTYSLAAIQSTFQMTYDPGELGQYIGNPVVGWKVAWSDRMVAIFSSL